MDTILIIEDEPKIADLLAKYLRASDFKTHWINNGLEVLPWIKENNPQLIVLDLMIPGMDGLEVCKIVRQISTIPIIMLTARVEEIDRLLGLELGADDYICKPFSPREVIARIKAVLRRTQPIQSTNISEPEPNLAITLNREYLSATINNQEIKLTLVEFELLETLHKHPGRIFSRQTLMEQAYADHRIVSDRTIDSHIKKLRKKLSDVLPEEVIHSVYSVGYKYEP